MCATLPTDGHRSTLPTLPATILATTIRQLRVLPVTATARLSTINSRNTSASAPLVMLMILNHKALTMEAEPAPWNKTKIAAVAVQVVTASVVVIFDVLVTRGSASLVLA